MSLLPVVLTLQQFQRNTNMCIQYTHMCSWGNYGVCLTFNQIKPKMWLNKQPNKMLLLARRGGRNKHVGRKEPQRKCRTTLFGGSVNIKRWSCTTRITVIMYFWWLKLLWELCYPPAVEMHTGHCSGTAPGERGLQNWGVNAQRKNDEEWKVPRQKFSYL